MKLTDKVQLLAEQVKWCRWPHQHSIEPTSMMELCFGFKRHPLIWAACREYSGILRALLYAEGESMTLSDVITTWKRVLK